MPFPRHLGIIAAVIAAQPADALFGIAAWVVFIGFVVATAVLSARARRKRLVSYVDERGWTLRACRHRWPFLSPRWNDSYEVVVEDHTGHVIEGTAFVTGCIRRKVWIDW